jgi:hypothetical protein
MTAKPINPVSVRWFYRLALCVGFSASALTLLALLNFRVLYAVFSHWLGLGALLMLVNPFVAVLVRNTILRDGNRPRQVLLLSCAVVLVPVGYVVATIAS